MTTTHPDPHTCPARGVELRTADEIEAERQHYRMRCEALWPGWKLVPVVPTPSMVYAAEICDGEYYFREIEDARNFAAELFTSMAAAAPASPA